MASNDMDMWSFLFFWHKAISSRNGQAQYKWHEIVLKQSVGWHIWVATPVWEPSKKSWTMVTLPDQQLSVIASPTCCTYCVKLHSWLWNQATNLWGVLWTPFGTSHIIIGQGPPGCSSWGAQWHRTSLSGSKRSTAVWGDLFVNEVINEFLLAFICSFISLQRLYIVRYSLKRQDHQSCN